MKGSWLFSCFGSLQTQKLIKHILSSVKKDAPKGIFTYFKAFFSTFRQIFAKLIKVNLRLYVYKLSNFEIKKGEVKILTSDKMSIKNNNSILNWRCFYWAFCKMITSISYNVTVSGRLNRTIQLISWSSYTQKWHFRVRKLPQQD